MLTYRELWGAAAASCPTAGAPGTILGYPACVYGFFMYLVIATLSFLGSGWLLFACLPALAHRALRTRVLFMLAAVVVLAAYDHLHT